MMKFDHVEDPVKAWHRWAKQNDPLLRLKRGIKLKFNKLKRRIWRTK